MNRNIRDIIQKKNSMNSPLFYMYIRMKVSVLTPYLVFMGYRNTLSAAEGIGPE